MRHTAHSRLQAVQLTNGPPTGSSKGRVRSHGVSQQSPCLTPRGSRPLQIQNPILVQFREESKLAKNLGWCPPLAEDTDSTQ